VAFSWVCLKSTIHRGGTQKCPRGWFGSGIAVPGKVHVLVCLPGGPWPGGVVGPILAWHPNPSPLPGAGWVPAWKALNSLQHHLSFFFLIPGGGQTLPKMKRKNKKLGGCLLVWFFKWCEITQKGDFSPLFLYVE